MGVEHFIQKSGQIVHISPGEKQVTHPEPAKRKQLSVPPAESNNPQVIGSDSEEGTITDLLADRLRVLGHPTRIRLLYRLHASSATVLELVEAVGGAQQNISQHLAILHQAGVVSRKKQGLASVTSFVSPE